MGILGLENRATVTRESSILSLSALCLPDEMDIMRGFEPRLGSSSLSGGTLKDR